ncbi:MAG: protein kinase domain-containing protein, partial [Myxococcota bacterium]
MVVSHPMSSGRRELEFTGVIGRGGFGSVYLANLRSSNGLVRPVAVKVMKAGLEAEPELLARQRDEARLLGRINHDAFVKVLELTTVDGRPAVVMDYVVGADLSELMAEAPEGRMGPGPALEIVAAAAGALDAAWNGVDPIAGTPLRVVHRDVKPANLLVTPEGNVKVLDFGIARADFAEREGQTRSNFFGTPRFMAPEQWTGATYGGEVDVYALGVTLYELVSGRKWERCPLTAGAFAAQQAELLDAGELDPGLRALVAEMTAFDGARRPSAADVRAVALGLAGDLGGERLAAFAARAVTPIVKARKVDAGDAPLPERHTLSDSMLAPTGTTLAKPAPPRGGLGVGIAGLLAGVALATLLGVALAGGAWAVLSLGEAEAPSPAPVAAEPPGSEAAAEPAPVEPP